MVAEPFGSLLIKSLCLRVVQSHMVAEHIQVIREVCQGLRVVQSHMVAEQQNP